MNLNQPPTRGNYSIPHPIDNPKDIWTRPANQSMNNCINWWLMLVFLRIIFLMNKKENKCCWNKMVSTGKLWSSIKIRSNFGKLESGSWEIKHRLIRWLRKRSRNVRIAWNCCISRYKIWRKMWKRKINNAYRCKSKSLSSRKILKIIVKTDKIP